LNTLWEWSTGQYFYHGKTIDDPELVTAPLIVRQRNARRNA